MMTGERFNCDVFNFLKTSLISRSSKLFYSFVFQGLVHLGKGTLTLGPYHCDRSLMMPVAVGGLLSVLVSFLDVKNGRSLITFSVSKIGLCRQGMNGINYPYSLLILVMHMTP